MFEFIKVSKSGVCENLNLRIEKGKTVRLHFNRAKGLSFVRMVWLDELPDAGLMVLDGVPHLLFRWCVHLWRKKLCFVPDRPLWDGSKSMLENLLEAYILAGYSRNQAIKAITERSVQFGIEYLLRLFPHELGHLESVLFSLVRGLATSPSYIVVEEFLMAPAESRQFERVLLSLPMGKLILSP